MAKNPSSGERLLTSTLGHARGVNSSTTLLLMDTLLAIGFAAGLAGALDSLAAKDERFLNWLGLIMTAGVARGVVTRISAQVGASAATRAKVTLRHRLVTRLLSRRSGAPSETTGGGLMNAVVDEVEAIDGYVARFVPARRAAGFAPMIVLAAALWASPIAALILVGTLPPFIAMMAFAGASSAAESKRQFVALARLSSLFVDRLRALPVVLAFRAEARETARLAQASDDVALRTFRVLRLAFLSSAVLEFFAALCVALVAVYAGFNLLGLLPFHVAERLDLARSFFVLALAPEFYAPMRRLAATYHDRQAATAVAERLACIVGGDDAARAAVAPVFAAPPRIRFESVTLAHADGAEPAVSGLSFDLSAGCTLAIVGPSGSGKTTILRMLLGASDGLRLVSGRIRIGGSDWTTASSLARQSAWVGQSPLIVPGTLRDNLRLAAADASDADLAAVVEQVGLDRLLTHREGGLDTRLDARGSGLSGGERRRIALARALLKPTSIWLLDEPTAHLDEASELAFIKTIASTRAGRTTLIATHSARLAGIADVVVQLGDHA